jgi:hypothetical protein
MGCDLGQVNDFTALCLLEHVEFEDKTTEICERKHEWHLRGAKRLPLGTSYQDIARHIKDRIHELEEDLGGRVTLIVDATGVGRPVIDMLMEDGLKPVAVTVTAGHKVVVDDGEYHVPKRDLVSAAKVMLGKEELKIADGTPYADVLVHELEVFQIKVNIAGHDTYEAPWRVGEHDDLVFSLSLACWWALQKKHFITLKGTDTSEGAISDDDYRIGWAPARGSERGALAVYNVDHSSVVLFERLKHQTVQEQIDKVFQTARRYNDAAVWAQAGTDEALFRALLQRGASVKRVEMTPEEWTSAYQNLYILASYEQIKLPNDPGLLADIQAGQNSSVTALCLVTYNIHPDIEATRHEFDPDRDFDPDLDHSFVRGGPMNRDYRKYIDLDDYSYR